MKILLAIVAFLLAAIIAAFLVLRTPDTDRDGMIAKYGGPDAMFADGPGGMKVHWRDEGCRDCPAMILLHGSGASLHTFAPLIPRLGAEYRVITFDQPGHGLTGPHPMGDYSAGGLSQALDAVAAAAGLEHFILGGNSMGGWVSWRYALAHPERVDALLLIDAAGAPMREGETPPAPSIGFRLLRNPLTRPIAEHVTPREVIAKTLLDSVAVDEIVDDAMIDRYWELLRFPGNRRATVKRAVTDREDDFAARLKEIAAPALVLWGAEDTFIPKSAATTFDERIPNADIVILDGVGHIPMEEAPERTANAILRFLEKQRPDAQDNLVLEMVQ